GDDSGRSTAVLGITLGVAVGAVVLALLAALWRSGVPPLARVAALSAIPPIGVFFLIGLYRFRLTFLDLYESDRYFYLLLIPIALLSGAIAASISLADWPRLARVTFAFALSAGVTCEIGLHRRAMLRLVPFEVYAVHGRSFAALERLVHHLESAGPIEIPHDRVWYAGMCDRVDSAVLTNVLSDGKRLRLGGAHVDEQRLNPLLDDWAREIGETVPFVRIIDGHLINTHFPTNLDFSKESFDTLILGFHGWERPFRWMGSRGELFVMLGSSDLTLSLAAPVSDLRRSYPAWTSIPVHVSLVDTETGFAAPLGVIEITEDGVHDYRLPTSPMTSHGGIGLIVQITLDCDRVWKPSEVYGTADRNDRTIQVFSAGTRFSP
ncbi:MAG TPA: hypothetical protein VF713_03395, partial [Thermoanaerobaculia bacterium]